jgi:hypothetical protein
MRNDVLMGLIVSMKKQGIKSVRDTSMMIRGAPQLQQQTPPLVLPTPERRVSRPRSSKILKLVRRCINQAGMQDVRSVRRLGRDGDQHDCNKAVDGVRAVDGYGAVVVDTDRCVVEIPGYVGDACLIDEATEASRPCELTAIREGEGVDLGGLGSDVADEQVTTGIVPRASMSIP